MQGHGSHNPFSTAAGETQSVASSSQVRVGMEQPTATTQLVGANNHHHVPQRSTRRCSNAEMMMTPQDSAAYSPRDQLGEPAVINAAYGSGSGEYPSAHQPPNYAIINSSYEMTQCTSSAAATAPIPPTAANAKGIHWYKCRVETAGSFSTPAMADCAWLLQRATRQVYFQDGLLADVTSAYGGVFETVQPTSRSIGEELYFTLPEWFPSAEDASTEMLQYAPFPSEYAGGDAGVNNAGGGGQEPDGLLSTGSYGVFAGKQRYSSTSSSTGSLCTKEGIKQALGLLFLVAVSVLILWADLEICRAIGRTSVRWSNVFAWLILGSPFFIFIALCIPYTIYGCFVEESDRRVGLVVLMLFMLFIFSCSFGAPLAWARAQMKVGSDYLAADKLKTLNCWRNPQDTFETVGHHFIVFEEADWTVDYKTRQNQGVRTLAGSDNNGDDNGKRYNFCVAPIRYNGLPSCPQNFYAVCFRETSSSYLASCDDNDAKTCGWDFPSPMNLIRTMNRNEQFWSGVEEEDEEYWRSAVGFATPSYKSSSSLASVAPSSPLLRSSVIGFYSGEGPYEIGQYYEKAEKLDKTLFIVAMAVYGGLMLLASVVSFLCCGDDHHASCGDCGDCGDIDCCGAAACCCSGTCVAAWVCCLCEHCCDSD